MASHRRPKFLTCFYCGCRTSTRYDGFTQQFTCPTCDATNYLDKNGEITDPPVATTAAQPVPVHYALAGSTPPKTSNPSSEIFCKTCLEHQRLFTASLAQYLPDDPSSPDYAQAERDYYKFRRGLERRYPQICADCEPKVLERIRQAGYTARTDHLRRMIDHSKESRGAKQRSFLDVVDLLGKLLWFAGLVLQVLWHASTLLGAAEESTASQKWPSWTQQGFQAMGYILGCLPGADSLIRASILSSVCSSWWNPRFVQTVRGFTRHIVGLSNWYTYQAMIVLLRAMFTKISTMPAPQVSPFFSQVGAHLFMALFMLYIYNLAQRSVRTDTTPLFGTTSPSPIRPIQTRASAQDVDDKSMSHVLDEILKTPTPTPGLSSSRQLHANSFEGPDFSGSCLSSTPLKNTLPSNPYASNRQQLGAGLELGALNLSEDIHHQQDSQYLIESDDEMDWAPTHSQHRAFSAYGTNVRQSQGFGHTPVEPKKGPIWFKVPPAPVSPAQRRLKPASPPIRRSPVVKEEFHFHGANRRASRPADGTDGGRTSDDIAFAAPKLFVESEQSDPRNTLSDLFGESFSLTPSQERTADDRRRRRASAKGGIRAGESSRPLKTAEVAVLLFSGLAWLHATVTQHEYGAQVTLAVTAACALISARTTGETMRELRARKEESPRWAAIGAALGVVELGMTAVFGLQVWRSDGDGGEVITSQGGWLIGLMVSHQLCNLIL